MHEVAEAAASALAHFIISATSLSEVGDGRELADDWLHSEPPVVHSFSGLFAVLFPVELDVDVSDQMVAKILANVHFFDFSVFIFDLEEDFFVELVVVLLQHGLRNLLAAVIVEDRRAVEILQQHCLRKSRFVVQTRAAIAVMTRADFEVEGTVDLILLSSKDGSQVLGSCVRVHR